MTTKSIRLKKEKKKNLLMMVARTGCRDLHNQFIKQKLQTKKSFMFTVFKLALFHCKEEEYFEDNAIWVTLLITCLKRKFSEVHEFSGILPVKQNSKKKIFRYFASQTKFKKENI